MRRRSFSRSGIDDPRLIKENIDKTGGSRNPLYVSFLDTWGKDKFENDLSR